MAERMAQIKRVKWELLITLLVVAMFMSGVYELIPPAIQLLTLKAVQVSLGFVHAHLIGKVAFPTVVWDDRQWTPAHVIRVALYVVVPYCYALGG